VKAWGWSLFMEAKPLTGLTLRSITAYRKDDSASPIDFDATASQDVDVPAYYRNRQTSQEFQALYPAAVQRHGGLLLSECHALTQFDVRLFTTVSGLTAYTDAKIVTDTMAGFANMTYDFTDHISLEAGGRYTWDKRGAHPAAELSGRRIAHLWRAGIALAPQHQFPRSATYTKFTPRASINWRPDSNNTIYASYSQGFKGGGFDPRGVGVNAPAGVSQGEFLSFRPEKVNSYEVGVKTRLFDRRLSLNLAAFRMDYTDVQIPGSVACTVSACPASAAWSPMRARRGCRAWRPKGASSWAGHAQRLAGLYRCQISAILTLINGVTTDVAAYRKVQNTPHGRQFGHLHGAGAQGHAGPDRRHVVEEHHLSVRSAQPLSRPARLCAVRCQPGLSRAGRALDAGRLWQEPGRQALQDLGLHLCGGPTRHRALTYNSAGKLTRRWARKAC
jgi:iron complex outermembrane receptor protein